MKFRFFSTMFVMGILTIGFTGCSKDEPNGGGSNVPGSDKHTGNYGSLDGNLITIGSTRDVTYTSCVLLGTVDFSKMSSDHTYGVVYMEGVKDPEFDYDMKLHYGGHSDRTDKESYDCIDLPVSQSTLEGKFEKQLVNLKPATTYYYRAFVKIGNNVNYSKVEAVTTQDPTPEISMATLEPSDIYAVKGTLNGVVNIGNLQDVNEDQQFGFIISEESMLNDPEKLTYEYYETWQKNHFETEDDLKRPEEYTTNTNLNGRVNFVYQNKKPGTEYYYRTFFKWKGKYFYSPEVKTIKTLGTDVITVGTEKADYITSYSAILGGNFPYDLVGKENVEVGFLISKVYSNSSEFIAEEAEDWKNHLVKPKANVFAIWETATEKDFETYIDGLTPETTYYYCAVICLYRWKDEKGKNKAIYSYGPIQHFVTGKELKITSSGLYPWTHYTNDGDYWKSGNAGRNNSTSTLKIVMPPAPGQKLVLELEVSSEPNHDYVEISYDDQTLPQISGEQVRTIEVPVSATNETTIYVKYIKDGDENQGDDCAIVSLPRLVSSK